MTADSEQDETPAPYATGCSVVARDGRELGRVAEVHGAALRVVNGDASFWVDASDLERVGETALMLLAGVEGPPEARGDDYVDFEARPAFTPDDERRQRELMESQLHEQAQALDRTALHPKHEVPGMAPTDVAAPERVRGETLPLEKLLDFREHPLLAADGEEIGVIREFISDESTTRPEWIAVESGGLLGGRRALAPVFGAYVLGDKISVPYTCEQVMASPAQTEEMTPAARRELGEHYGLAGARGRTAA